MEHECRVARPDVKSCPLVAVTGVDAEASDSSGDEGLKLPLIRSVPTGAAPAAEVAAGAAAAAEVAAGAAAAAEVAPGAAAAAEVAAAALTAAEETHLGKTQKIKTPAARAGGVFTIGGRLPAPPIARNRSEWHDAINKDWELAEKDLNMRKGPLYSQDDIYRHVQALAQVQHDIRQAPYDFMAKLSTETQKLTLEKARMNEMYQEAERLVEDASGDEAVTEGRELLLFREASDAYAQSNLNRTAQLRAAGFPDMPLKYKTPTLQELSVALSLMKSRKRAATVTPAGALASRKGKEGAGSARGKRDRGYDSEVEILDQPPPQRSVAAPRPKTQKKARREAAIKVLTVEDLTTAEIDTFNHLTSGEALKGGDGLAMKLSEAVALAMIAATRAEQNQAAGPSANIEGDVHPK